LSGIEFDRQLPARGAELFGADGKEVGRVTSAVESPQYGPIGLGYVRREVAAGAVLRWADGRGEGVGTAVPLPFRDASV
jgi:glycine cleavage system aminomethyltransferase T